MGRALPPLLFQICRDGCGHTVLGVGSGSLASLGYPLSYPSNSVCEWEISVTTGHTIIVRITDLDIDTSNCQVSYLRLYNGHGPGRTEIDLITCLEKGEHFSEAEFSLLLSVWPGFMRVWSPTLWGGQISVVSSKGIPHYESSLANNVTSVPGVPRIELAFLINLSNLFLSALEMLLHQQTTPKKSQKSGNLSPSLFTFKTSGCYGTLGLESGVVSDSQITASSEWEWGGHGKEPTVWGPTGARLKTPGRPWAAANSDTKEWIQVDLKKEKKITGRVCVCVCEREREKERISVFCLYLDWSVICFSGITTTGSTLQEYQFYVSAYEVFYSHDGQQWKPYQEVESDKNKIFQGNTNYLQEVRNNFIPPIEARFIRICPLQWHQRIALKMELLGCQPHAARPRIFHPPPPPPRRKSTVPPLQERTTQTPNIRNTTMPPHSHDDVALVAVLVPVLVVVLTTPVLVMVCSWLWKNSPEVTYDLPHWERTVWWKSMKQLLPSKLDGDDCVRYSSTARVDHQRPRVEPAEYAQPLVTGTMASLGQRSTFKPEEGEAPEYDAPIPPEHYHAYAEPLPASGTEYATPIMIDRANHLSGGTLPFRGRGLVARTDSSQSASSAYDTPKNTSDQATPTEGELYQVPQNTHNAPCQKKD
ncbi:Discoidin, CUB and LCCL domain-containing protein 2 [Labeo rohita]|uniref:Discoidin, CUB and LCCL domain-containing protein 2 n=1 Tax=Labeo rohita TaxID=84645 RepID=A0ABQ8MFS6_LABRO|nr:Discoidin, CUB and LCCL domain-containing protein 2 [Labeo rohita]